eukprot:scaffold90180_cov75-Phaeocystis_antarctica.AAC.4
MTMGKERESRQQSHSSPTSAIVPLKKALNTSSPPFRLLQSSSGHFQPASNSNLCSSPAGFRPSFSKNARLRYWYRMVLSPSITMCSPEGMPASGSSAAGGCAPSSMHTSGYDPVLRPAGFRLNIACWPCPLEYEQPLGTHPSDPASTTLTRWPCKSSPSACVASCTAAKHSLSAALRWPSGQPVNCPGSS